MADDTLVLTGPVLQQISVGALEITPTGGTQTTLAAALAAGGGSSGPIAATTLTASSTVTLSPVNANVAVSPSGTGTVTVSPAGALTVNPTAASTINNTSVGVTTAAAVRSTTLAATGAVTLSPASANVVLSPTGTGVVTIAPATLGSVDNVTVGGTTPAAGTFTGATVTGNNGLKLTNQTSDAGAQTATLTNGPTAGNPAFWVRVTVNGVNLAIPAWTAV